MPQRYEKACGFRYKLFSEQRYKFVARATNIELRINNIIYIMSAGKACATLALPQSGKS